MHERPRVHVVSRALLPAPAVLDVTTIASDHVPLKTQQRQAQRLVMKAESGTRAERGET